jgi:Flp pilus assembly pilin Flp
MNSGAQAALNGVVIYQAGTGNVSINGAAGSSLSGAIYAPNADLTLSGTAASVTCFQAVAKTVTIQGTYTLDTSGCPASTFQKPVCRSGGVSLMPNLLKDRSGAAAVEFGLVALPFFMLMIGTFDLGVYALFKHSAGTLSAAGSRQVIIQAGTA